MKSPFVGILRFIMLRNKRTELNYRQTNFLLTIATYYACDNASQAQPKLHQPSMRKMQCMYKT